jgi:auxin efflux carrier family protein
LGLKCVVIVAILCVRFVLLPLIGNAVIHATYELSFLSRDPLYRYVLMVQFVVPLAMNIGTYAHETLKPIDGAPFLLCSAA